MGVAEVSRSATDGQNWPVRLVLSLFPKRLVTHHHTAYLLAQILHTQEVRSSSLRTPTIRINNLRSIGLCSVTRIVTRIVT